MEKRNIATTILTIVLILALIPTTQAEYKNEQKIDVIIKLKDNNEKNLFMTKKEQILSKTKIIESQKKFSEKIGKDKIKIKQTLTTQNIFSAIVDMETYEALKKNPEIEYVVENIKLKINLVNSTELINATRAWEHQINGINITGEGTSVCIIDTGIDYIHEAFGSCTNLSLQAIGDEEELITESIHPYESNYTNITTITMPGYSSMAVYFKNISVENGYDYVQILDENNNVIQTYTGFHQNIWTPHVEGDTIKIRMISDGSVTDYGYYSDKVLNGTTNRTCEKIPTGYDFVNNDDDPYDDEGHGTHVAGIVAADGSIKGVAPKAKLIIAKAMDENGIGDALVVASAIEWCTLNKEAYNITAISMSLGSAEYNNTYCDQRLPLITYLINQAVLKNISVVIATGNENQYSQISFPSCIINATRVTATSKTDTFPSFANRGGLFNDILTAPGENINSATIGGGWGLNSGTSMSTPHVSGAIALIKQYLELRNKAKTPKQIENLLNNTGVLLFDSESNKNYSRIDVFQTIYYLSEKDPVITSYEPQNANVLIRKNNTMIFNHTSWDEFNRTLYYYWYLEEVIESQVQNFTLNSTELETGNYNLTLVVSNNETNISISWNITIAPPKIDIEFNYSNNITNFEWMQATNKNNAINLSNHFIIDPYEIIEYALINSTKINMTITNNIVSFFVTDNNYYGEQIVLIELNDSNSSAQSNEFTLKINEKIEETPRTSGGGGSRGGGGGGLPPINTSKYSEIIIEADKEIKISNNNDKVPFKELQIKINKKIENSRIVVEALKEKPEQTNSIKEKIYKTISITHTNLDDEDIDEVIIKFSVEKNWAINNSIDKDSIKLLRYTKGWKELKTRYVSFDANNYYYESISPGLSLFAITAQEEQEIEPPRFDKNESTVELFIVEENETLIEQEQLQTIQEPKQKNKMNEFTIKIISAIPSIIAILLVIIIINEFAKKRAKKMLKQKEEELKILEKQDTKHK